MHRVLKEINARYRTLKHFPVLLLYHPVMKAGMFQLFKLNYYDDTIIRLPWYYNVYHQCIW